VWERADSLTFFSFGRVRLFTEDSRVQLIAELIGRGQATRIVRGEGDLLWTSSVATDNQYQNPSLKINRKNFRILHFGLQSSITIIICATIRILESRFEVFTRVTTEPQSQSSFEPQFPPSSVSQSPLSPVSTIAIVLPLHDVFPTHYNSAVFSLVGNTIQTV